MTAAVSSRLQADHPALILASASAARRGLLAAAGLQFQSVATGIDEHSVKYDAARDGSTAEDTAHRLARLKAGAVNSPGALVIGADQILVCDDIWYDKPADLPAARVQLQALRGRRHTLATATVAMQDGDLLWQHVATPSLTMRAFSDSFLDAYLAEEADRLLGSVGAYRLEGPGIQLFDSIEGEHSAILGLPLPPLLAFLRNTGTLPS